MNTRPLTFFSRKLAPGGITEVTLRLCRALRSRGVDVRILVEEGEALDDRGVRIDRGTVDDARRAAAGGRLIVSTSGRDSLRLVKALGSQAKVSLLHIQHVPLWMARAGFIANIRRVAGGWWCFRSVSAVFTVSRGIAAAIRTQARVPGEKVLYVPNAILDDDGDVVVPASFDIAGPPRFVFVGRLHFQKDVPFLLRAFARVARRVPSASLDVVGDGPDRRELVGMVSALGLTEAVRFVGWKSQKEIGSFAHDATAVLLSSRWEGLPTVLVECGARGLPFIARGCATGPDELVDGKSGGVVTPFADEGAFADAVLKAALNPVAFRRNHLPSASVLSQFSAVHASDAFLKALSVVGIESSREQVPSELR